VDITPTEISLPLPPPSGAGNSFYFFDSSGSFLQWSLSPNPPQPPYQKYEAYGPYPNHVHYWLAENSAPLYTTTVPWVIAEAQSTPEPTSITLLVSGFLTAGGFGLYRRRRGKATEPTSAN
jgi:hypothetical protein